jgi:hypothetical protein
MFRHRDVITLAFRTFKKECTYIYILVYTHHHKHQGLDPLIRSVSTVTTAPANVSSVFQLFSFLVVCSGMILKGFGFLAYYIHIYAYIYQFLQNIFTISAFF